MGCLTVNTEISTHKGRYTLEKAFGSASVSLGKNASMTCVLGVRNPKVDVDLSDMSMMDVEASVVREPVDVSIRLVCSTAGRFLDLSEYDVWVVNGVAYPVDVYSNVKWRVD